MIDRPDHQFGWRAHILGGYFRKWVILGTLIGIVAGLGAILFFVSIDFATNFFLVGIVGFIPPATRGEGAPQVTEIGRRWLIPLVTTIGGLVSGLLVFTLAPEAEGHGTDAAIAAFHHRGGKIRSRVPLIKLVASSITIGSGGSAGREGPTAQIAAGFGSWLGDLFQLTPHDRRIALAVGMGAGIGAIFKAPLGGAVLSAEILYLQDFELEAIVPGFIASVIGYSIFGAWSGWTPVFGSGLSLPFDQPQELGWYAVLGIAAGLIGILYVRVFYAVRDAFHAIRLPKLLKPAIGGLVVGLIGLAFPQVLSMGYGWIQLAIDGDTTHLAVSVMLALVMLKILATSLTISSGGSGGVFAPGLYIGGMLGGSLWWILQGHVPWLPPTPAPFVVVGMMALFGGIAKAPIAVILMVAEMTGEFSMMIPAMLATTLAYLVSGEISIYENQVLTRAHSPAHRGEYAIPLVQEIPVGQAMLRADVVTTPDESVQDVEDRMYKHGIRGLPVLQDGVLVGVFTVSDALRARKDHKTVVSEVMSRDLVVAYPSDSTLVALEKLSERNISHLPVVDRDAPRRLVGIVTLRELTAALGQEVRALSSLPGRPPLEPSSDLLQSILVSSAMTRQIEVITPETSLVRVANRLAGSNQHAALITDERGALTGIITLDDLDRMIDTSPDQPVGTLTHQPVIVARPLQSVAEALSHPEAGGLRQIPVVEDRDGIEIPIGLLRRSDVVASYLRARDRQALLARRAKSFASTHADDMAVIELHVSPKSLARGKRLSDLHLPQESLITSVFREGRMLIPRGELDIQTGDYIRIISTTVLRAQILHVFADKHA